MALVTDDDNGAPSAAAGAGAGGGNGGADGPRREDTEDAGARGATQSGKRRLLTIFAGGDGFSSAATHGRAAARWETAGFCENNGSLIRWWEEEHGEGKLLGPYFTEVDDEGRVTKGVFEMLKDGELDLGVIDACVITAPCQDFCKVNPDAQGATGSQGRLFASTPEFVERLARTHDVGAFVFEEAQETLDEPTLTDPDNGLLAVLARANYWSAHGTVQFWRVGVPSTRSRMGLVAVRASRMRRPGPFELPGGIPADGSYPRPPALQPYLLPPDAVPDELRENSADMEWLPADHRQSAPPAYQVGRMRNEQKSAMVYCPRKGTGLTLRANTYRAEGPGNVTGLYWDGASPRRLAPVEVLRMHAFPERLARHPTRLIYKVVGNSVPVQWAEEVLHLIDALLQ